MLTGDLPRPVKYFNPDIETAYHSIERVAREKLLGTFPAALQPDYQALLAPGPAEGAYLELVKAADKLCAYIKCLEETSAGNREFAEAEKVLRQSVESVDLPEVRYFLTHLRAQLPPHPRRAEVAAEPPPEIEGRPGFAGVPRAPGGWGARSGPPI